ncbi:uncharacterized protein C1orf185 homolog isoform X2 [Notamacropus eugenii]|uniref:uncharacterized protein C1orf185 homolog isoform X2 n=1 Tax=Notamacropus eugenii TaxID=9315 RepID=UPI003B66FD3F
MPRPALRLLLLVLSLAAAAPTSRPGPAEPEPEAAAAAGQVKENRPMTETTPPGWLSLESSEQEGLQKDHLTYKFLWEKEELVVLRNGMEFDLNSEMRASTYKNKKLQFRNIVLKLPLFQGKQANNGIRKATLPQRRLGRKNVSPALTKTRVSALVRKTRRIEKQNMKTELQKELENAPSKISLSAETPLQFATADLDKLARKWKWLKAAFLKAPLNAFAFIVRNSQGIRGNLEDDPKPPKKDALSSSPLKLTSSVRQNIRIWKLSNLKIVHREPRKLTDSERTPSVGGEGEPEKDEIVLKALCGSRGSLNSSANGTGAWKVQSRFKILFGRSTKMGKGLPTPLTSMKTKSMIIQRIQGFGNRLILSVTESAHISNGDSRDPSRRKNSTESRHIIQVVSGKEGQETKVSALDFIQERLKFLFKVTSKDREHRMKNWSVYERVPSKLQERKVKTFQKKIDRVIDQDGSPTDPRTPKRKPEVSSGANALEDEGKTSQWLRSEEDGAKNLWSKVQVPSPDLPHSQLYIFTIRPHFNNSVLSQEKLTAFIETFVAQLPRKSQARLAKLTGVLAAHKAVISPKASSFPLESQQTNPIRNMGKMKRFILNLWKTKHTFPTVLPGDFKLRSEKLVESNDHDVSVTIHYQKLLHDSQSLSSDLYFLGFAPSHDLSKRQKRDAHGDARMTQVPVDFLNHLSSLLGVGVGIVAVAFIVLSIVVGILFYKRRELFQVSKVTVIDGKCQKKLSSSTVDSCFRSVSLSRCFHSSGLQVSRDKELELQGALQKQKQRKLNFVMTSITSDVSDPCSSVESINVDQRSSFSSSLGSFYCQSLEASRDWFSDEEGSLCSYSKKDSFVDRVQVYLETMYAAENFQEFQCDVAINEDQNYLGLEKTNQQKMQMPKSVSNLPKASSDIPHPPELGDDTTKASTSTPHPPQSEANASEASSGIPYPPQSRADPNKASISTPHPPELGANASEASSGILHPPQSKANASEASSGIPHPSQSRDDPNKDSTSTPYPPESGANASEASSGTPHPLQSRDDPSRASTHIPCLPQSGNNASKTASDISCLPQSSKTSMDVPISEPK